jgi:hypothetical protein
MGFKQRAGQVKKFRQKVVYKSRFLSCWKEMGMRAWGGSLGDWWDLLEGHKWGEERERERNWRYRWCFLLLTTAQLDRQNAVLKVGEAPGWDQGLEGGLMPSTKLNGAAAPYHLPLGPRTFWRCPGFFSEARGFRWPFSLPPSFQAPWIEGVSWSSQGQQFLHCAGIKQGATVGWPENFLEIFTENMSVFGIALRAIFLC